MNLKNLYIAPLRNDGNYGALSFVGAVAVMFILNTLFNLIRKKDETAKPINIKDRYKATVRSFDGFFNDLLPYTLRYNTTIAVFARKLVEEHDCVRFYVQSKNKHQDQAVRNQSWLLVCYKMLTLLSCNVVLAILYYPSNHECSDRDFDGCTRVVKVNTIGSLCAWNENKNMCENSSELDTYGFTLTVLLVTMCATSLLDKLFKFTLSHAALAVKTRRLGWLYNCRLNDVDSTVPELAVRGVRNVQVAAREEWESGRHTLGMPSTALVVKPSNPRRTSYSNSKIFVAENLEENGQDATLSLSLEEAEKGLEHFGDEWKALSVQSRHST